MDIKKPALAHKPLHLDVFTCFTCGKHKSGLELGSTTTYPYRAKGPFTEYTCKTCSKLTKLLGFMLENDYEIVSYGLAPNPNGFCYEYQGKDSKRDWNLDKYISDTLESLNREESEMLRKLAL